MQTVDHITFHPIVLYAHPQFRPPFYRESPWGFPSVYIHI